MNDALKILKTELIGRQLRLVRKKDGFTINAKIIDETKNTVVVQHENTRKRLIKALYALEFGDGGKAIRIDGKHFLKRPEERIKTKLMKRW
jgi:RNase P/RNase MRP subunit p29